MGGQVDVFGADGTGRKFPVPDSSTPFRQEFVPVDDGVYCDIASKDDFDWLFGDTYVGSHPTPERNAYQVLRLDFSKPGGTEETLETNVDGYLDLMYGDFVSRYANYYPAEYLTNYKALHTTSDRINYVHQMFHTYRIKSYLIVDEYDNFTNNVLNQHGEAVYHAMTHAEGFYRDLFKKFKAETGIKIGKGQGNTLGWANFLVGDE